MPARRTRPAKAASPQLLEERAGWRKATPGTRARRLPTVAAATSQRGRSARERRAARRLPPKRMPAAAARRSAPTMRPRSSRLWAGAKRAARARSTAPPRPIRPRTARVAGSVREAMRMGTPPWGSTFASRWVPAEPSAWRRGRGLPRLRGARERPLDLLVLRDGERPRGRRGGDELDLRGPPAHAQRDRAAGWLRVGQLELDLDGAGGGLGSALARRVHARRRDDLQRDRRLRRGRAGRGRGDGPLERERHVRHVRLRDVDRLFRRGGDDRRAGRVGDGGR